MNLSHRISRLQLCLLGAALSVACATPQREDAAEEAIGTQRSAETTCVDGLCGTVRVPMQPDFTIAAGTCGDRDDQKKVSAAWSYILGGYTDPTTVYPCAAGESLSAPMSVLRSRISEGVCKVSRTSWTTACGLRAVVSRLKCIGLNESDLNTIGGLAHRMDRCWGPGASGFFNVESGSVFYRQAGDGTTVYDLHLLVDPEPVKLTSALGTTWPSSASATGVETGAAYIANFLGPSGVPVSYANPRLGRPCSSLAVGSGTVLNTFVQVDPNNLSWKKCL